MLGNFVNFSFHLLIFFFKINIVEKLFQEYHQSVKQFGSISAPTYVGPDLGPNCLQRYQQMTKAATSKERVNKAYDTNNQKSLVIEA